MPSAIMQNPNPHARVVSACWTPPDLTMPVSLIWLCECGHQGIDIPGINGWCPSCKNRIRIPDEPVKASREDLLIALERGCVTCNGCTPAGFKCRTCGAEA